MNIFELAREADLTFMSADAHCREDYFTATQAELERFAALVRADDEVLLRQALEALEQTGLDDTYRSYEFEHAVRAAIRARLKGKG